MKPEKSYSPLILRGLVTETSQKNLILELLFHNAATHDSPIFSAF
ncbi:hypothetical protein X474_27930 [Dethiosulfatarculus sandiegensis]|uniref:Uncharacterized protein n=1 Tax=Dethiosulfatarculus sandiegensis TaxID=1429043 RepID=A0A0D2IXL9_9BACT|nr:hypothetical protein X474_27930 [Dethiosulfatarculus sandiegensis]